MKESEETKPAVPLPRVLVVAEAQRNILYCILANFLAAFLIVFAMVLAGPKAGGDASPGAMEAVGNIVSVVVAILSMVFVYRLAKGLEMSVPVLVALVMFIPCFNILTLLLLSQKATALIRKAGFSVGLLGANIPEIRAAAQKLSSKTFE